MWAAPPTPASPATVRLTRTSRFSHGVVARLPLLFRGLRGHKISERKLNELIEMIRRALAIPDSAIQEELQTITDLREARSIREGDLKQIPVDIPLQDGELCYHRTTGQLFEKRVLRSYTVDRVRQKEEDLVPMMEGKLYITSKRILLMGDGVRSLPM